MKVYVVFEGHMPGVYNTWAECHQQTDGYKHNLHQSYPNREAGEHALLEHLKKKNKLKVAEVALLEHLTKKTGSKAGEEVQVVENNEGENLPMGDGLSTKDLIIGLLVVALIFQMYLQFTN